MKAAGFYSDPHFGHKNIVEFCERPFDNHHHMEEEMVKIYNSRVGPNDLIIWVGDCFFYKTWAEAQILLDMMNGYKVLIMGNHDVRNGKYFMAKSGFDAVIERELFMYIKGRICRVNHYPYWHTPHARKSGKTDDRYPDRRPEKVKGEALIHGHTHSSRRRNGNMVHVGVDAWDYGPAMMPDVELLVAEI
jgi:calcineurin-like phosphoesterase family protein